MRNKSKDSRRNSKYVCVCKHSNIGSVMALLGCHLDSKMNNNPEMESTPGRDFLLGLKWVSPLLDQTFETGIHTSGLDLEAGEDRP